MKAAYLFRLHLLKRRATGLYLGEQYGSDLMGRLVDELTTNTWKIAKTQKIKMNTAETRHTPTNTPHTIHRGISPQIHAATAVK